MNCNNCGAVLQLGESQRYFQCGHCGAFTFPAAETEGSDGIRILGHTADAPPCPVCHLPLAQAVIDSVHPVHFCGKCRGLLLSRPIFTGVVNTRRAWATDLPAQPVPLDSHALERRLSCPRCSMRFETYAHYGPGNVVIDNCTRCDQVWLDFGEIRHIVAAPGRDRGSRQITPIDDDYVRGGPGEDIDDPQPKESLAFLFDLFSR